MNQHSMAQEDSITKKITPQDDVRPSRDHAAAEADLRKGDILAIDATRDITIAEHDLKFWDAVRQYPTAVAWALFFCIAVVMAGFDAQLVTSFYAMPAFQQRFGYEYQGSYIISAPWQTALGMVGPIDLPSFSCCDQSDLSRATPSARFWAPSPAAGRSNGLAAA